MSRRKNKDILESRIGRRVIITFYARLAWLIHYWLMLLAYESITNYFNFSSDRHIFKTISLDSNWNSHMVWRNNLSSTKWSRKLPIATRYFKPLLIFSIMKTIIDLILNRVGILSSKDSHAQTKSFNHRLAISRQKRELHICINYNYTAWGQIFFEI